MAQTITFEITDSEYKALESVTKDPTDWAKNATLGRVAEATKPILEKLVDYCNENEITIETGKSAQITQAYDLGVVKTSAQQEEEFMAEMESRLQEQSGE